MEFEAWRPRDEAHFHKLYSVVGKLALLADVAAAGSKRPPDASGRPEAPQRVGRPGNSKEA